MGVEPGFLFARLGLFFRKCGLLSFGAGGRFWFQLQELSDKVASGIEAVSPAFLLGFTRSWDRIRSRPRVNPEPPNARPSKASSSNKDVSPSS